MNLAANLCLVNAQICLWLRLLPSIVLALFSTKKHSIQCLACRCKLNERIMPISIAERANERLFCALCFGSCVCFKMKIHIRCFAARPSFPQYKIAKQKQEAYLFLYGTFSLCCLLLRFCYCCCCCCCNSCHCLNCVYFTFGFPWAFSTHPTHMHTTLYMNCNLFWYNHHNDMFVLFVFPLRFSEAIDIIYVKPMCVCVSVSISLSHW